MVNQPSDPLILTNILPLSLKNLL